MKSEPIERYHMFLHRKFKPNINMWLIFTPTHTHTHRATHTHTDTELHTYTHVTLTVIVLFPNLHFDGGGEAFQLVILFLITGWNY